MAHNQEVVCSNHTPASILACRLAAMTPSRQDGLSWVRVPPGQLLPYMEALLGSSYNGITGALHALYTRSNRVLSTLRKSCWYSTKKRQHTCRPSAGKRVANTRMRIWVCGSTVYGVRLGSIPAASANVLNAEHHTSIVQRQGLWFPTPDISVRI